MTLIGAGDEEKKNEKRPAFGKLSTLWWRTEIKHRRRIHLANGGFFFFCFVRYHGNSFFLAPRTPGHGVYDPRG